MQRESEEGGGGCWLVKAGAGAGARATAGSASKALLCVKREREKMTIRNVGHLFSLLVSRCMCVSAAFAKVGAALCERCRQFL